MEGKGEQRMMKKYKARKTTVKAVRYTKDVMLSEDPWAKKIFCVDVENDITYVKAKGGALIRVNVGDVVCKDRQCGVSVYDWDSFSSFYEEA